MGGSSFGKGISRQQERGPSLENKKIYKLSESNSWNYFESTPKKTSVFVNNVFFRVQVGRDLRPPSRALGEEAGGGGLNETT